MEEMMVITREDPHTLTNQATTLPTSWKLYENPFYYTQQYHHNHHHNPLYLPHSSRNIAACLWDLTFVPSIMDSDLDTARAKIKELKAELEFERKVRKKAESINKKLYKELSEEKKKREKIENLCEKLAQEISSGRLEMDRMKKETGEERKMWRMAEVFREERVQMKLAEAKILLEEALESSKQDQVQGSLFKVKKTKDSEETMTTIATNESTTLGSSENLYTSNIGLVPSMTMITKRRASPEPENPHIKRGIKGFVEFPRVVRAMSSKGRQLGSKAECQKAQLRLLLRQKSPLPAHNLIMS